MLKAFLDQFDELRFEEFGWTTMVRAELVGGGAALRFHLRTDDTDPMTALWEVRCELWRDWCLTTRPGAGIQSVSLDFDHPLLIDYVEERTILAFRGRPVSAPALALALQHAHRATFSPFDVPSHLNRGVDLVRLLEGGFGTLAEGPVSLMRRYSEVCAAHGVEANLLPPRPAWQAAGAGDAKAGQELGALTFGSSYVIGAGFSAVRLPDADAP
jgi:hypothetical protein